MTKHAIRTMLPTAGGVILNWSSTGGMNGSPMPTSVYSAAKPGVIAFTKQATIEYGERGDPGERHLPGLHRDRDVGGQGRGRAVPGHGARVRA